MEWDDTFKGESAIEAHPNLFNKICTSSLCVQGWRIAISPGAQLHWISEDDLHRRDSDLPTYSISSLKWKVRCLVS